MDISKILTQAETATALLLIALSFMLLVYKKKSHK